MGIIVYVSSACRLRLCHTHLSLIALSHTKKTSNNIKSLDLCKMQTIVPLNTCSCLLQKVGVSSPRGFVQKGKHWCRAQIFTVSQEVERGKDRHFHQVRRCQTSRHLGTGTSLKITMSVMNLSARLDRTDTNTPWGFRMHGGSDYRAPLTIQRVSGHLDPV